MLGIPVATDMVSSVNVKVTPAKMDCPPCRWSEKSQANSWWTLMFSTLWKNSKHAKCWKQDIARGHACNSVRVFGSSLTCLPLPWCLLGACSPKAVSLWVSSSYSDETSDAMTVVRELNLGCPLIIVKLEFALKICHQGDNKTGTIRRGMMKWECGLKGEIYQGLGSSLGIVLMG